MTDLLFVEDSSVDFAFASNLFEHITQDDLAQVLSQLQRKLSAAVFSAWCSPIIGTLTVSILTTTHTSLFILI